jgi:hypothetical protein
MEPNFKAKIAFTVGLRESACITKIEEDYLLPHTETCDDVDFGLEKEGAAALLRRMGIDLGNKGSFLAEIKGVAYEDAPASYTIVNSIKLQKTNYILVLDMDSCSKEEAEKLMGREFNSMQDLNASIPINCCCYTLQEFCELKNEESFNLNYDWICYVSVKNG